MCCLIYIDFGWMKSSYHTAADEVKHETNSSYLCHKHNIMPYSWMISGNLKLVYQSFVGEHICRPGLLCDPVFDKIDNK